MRGAAAAPHAAYSARNSRSSPSVSRGSKSCFQKMADLLLRVRTRRRAARHDASRPSRGRSDVIHVDSPSCPRRRRRRAFRCGAGRPPSTSSFRSRCELGAGLAEAARPSPRRTSSRSRAPRREARSRWPRPADRAPRAVDSTLFAERTAARRSSMRPRSGTPAGTRRPRPKDNRRDGKRLRAGTTPNSANGARHVLARDPNARTALLAREAELAVPS
jgi:hypothetical protein